MLGKTRGIHITGTLAGKVLKSIGADIFLNASFTWTRIVFNVFYFICKKHFNFISTFEKGGAKSFSKDYNEVIKKKIK
jgi:hypothetical protein